VVSKSNEADNQMYRPLLGFLIAVGALAPALMGWRGVGGGGAANIGAIFEWIVGNTYIYVVFGLFGKQQSRLSREPTR
jgi:hypothetical protein